MDADLSSRVWFLPADCNKSNPKVIKSWGRFLRSRGNFGNWSVLNKRDFTWDKAGRFPYIFLVRTPLTFGHSQIVIPCPEGLKNADEEDFFYWASLIVKNAISAFRRAFKVEKIHETKQDFKKLARSTYTYGAYIKTLIVRASAQEDIDKEYKIHLIPYFKSHENECFERYRNLYTVPPLEPGGLIGWLGEKETLVDKWEVNGVPCPHSSLDDIAEDIWKLPQLAKKLRHVWP